MQKVCAKNFNSVQTINFCGTVIPQYKPLPPLKQDTFERTASKKEISFEGWPKIFSELNGICSQKMSKLSKAETDYLTELARKSVDQKLVDSVTRFSGILKRGLDAKFNKKYVFVSIGQSPAVLGEALSTMGVETAICPISKLTDLNNINSVLKNPRLNKYFDYMKKIGLDPEKMKNSGKQYLFIDYTSSGRSLKIFEDLLRHKKAGYNLPNVKFISLQNLIEACKPSNKEELNFISEFLQKYIHKSALKEYSPIFKLPVQDIHLVQEYRDKTPVNEKFNMLKFLISKNTSGK